MVDRIELEQTHGELIDGNGDSNAGARAESRIEEERSPVELPVQRAPPITQKIWVFVGEFAHR